MAVLKINIDECKSWRITGQIPTQSHFYRTICTPRVPSGVHLVLNYDHVMLGASKDLQGVDLLGDDHQHHNKSKGDEEDCGNVVGDLWHDDELLQSDLLLRRRMKLGMKMPTI